MRFPIRHIKTGDSLFPEIPKEIWNAPEPPQELFIQGSDQAMEILKKLPHRGLAIVGTRTPQPRSILMVENAISALRGQELIILSGLARGIDATAHQWALKTNLPTIAVLGAGLDWRYPQSTWELRDQILRSHGLLISEFPPGTPPLRFRFLQRNRLIATWSNATWVVEASYKSGALNTAKWAREQNRICFSVPSFPNDPAFLGNQVLLDRDHALSFWGAHSLGAAWIELATLANLRTPTPPDRQTLKEAEKDEKLFLSRVQILTSLHGGAHPQDLLNWAMTLRWSPTKFFMILEKAVHTKQVQDRHGILISNGASPMSLEKNQSLRLL